VNRRCHEEEYIAILGCLFTPAPLSTLMKFEERKHTSMTTDSPTSAFCYRSHCVSFLDRSHRDDRARHESYLCDLHDYLCQDYVCQGHLDHVDQLWVCHHRQDRHPRRRVSLRATGGASVSHGLSHLESPQCRSRHAVSHTQGFCM